MNDIETFIRLKYEIITSDQNTWSRLDRYPESVKKNWAWRCAADVEHLAKGHPAAEECICVAKQYRDGLATRKELDKAWQAVPFSNTNDARIAARAAYYAANTYFYAAGAAKAAANTYYFDASKQEEKWELYINWLIEELCEYENNKK